MIVELDNAWAIVTIGDDDEFIEDTLADLRTRLGYLTKDCEFSEAFRTGKWDGYITLLEVWRKDRWRTYYGYEGDKQYRFPSGLLPRATKIIKDHGLTCVLTDTRTKPEARKLYTDCLSDYGRVPRPYQEECVNIALGKSRGQIEIATGGGKTIALVLLLVRLGIAPVVITVPSTALLYQTHNELQKYIRENHMEVKIGMAGDSIIDLVPDGINVVTYQTSLAALGLKLNSKNGQVVTLTDDDYKKMKSSPESKLILKDLLNNTQVLISDEEHIAPSALETIGVHCSNAYYRWGLSATPDREDNQDIRIESVFAGLIYSKTASDLIEEGWLVPPYIFCVEVKNSQVTTGSNYQQIHAERIVRNWLRNYEIKKYAELMHAAGIPTIISVGKKEHGEILESMIEHSVFVPGGADFGEVSQRDKDFRQDILNVTGRNEAILIGTQWLSTGIDEPRIAGVIQADSYQSQTSVPQLIGRAIRPLGMNALESAANGKPCAMIVDLSDDHKMFRKHAQLRKKIYQQQRAYKVFNVR